MRRGLSARLPRRCWGTSARCWRRPASRAWCCATGSSMAPAPITRRTATWPRGEPPPFPGRRAGTGTFSFLHVEDAAAATAAALERGAPGIYNVVDDEPAPLHEWLPAYAEALGAKPPRRVPAWLAKLLAGSSPPRWQPSSAAPPTQRRNASSAGAPATQAGARASAKLSPEPHKAKIEQTRPDSSVGRALPW